jgi:hypothetical protein
MANQIVVSAGAKVRNLQDVIIGTSGVLTSLGFDVANGVPRLDVNGKILVSQLPNSVMEYKGTWNAATNTPTLVNGTGNQGDVYLCNVAGTVDFGAGAIAFVVGDQVIYSGSIWQRASGATGTVTSVAVTESGDSLNITGSPITTSGTINIGFNGTNLQYVNGAGNLTTFPTLITSIGLTMPSAFSVANSPLTANGTIAVTGAGVASQYIRGDGTLADFPTSGGGGSSVSYYLNGGTSQGTIGGTTYYEMSKTAVIGTGVDFAKSGDGFIVAFLTDANDPAQLNIPAGNWNYEIYASMSSNGGTPQMYAELYKYDGTTFTLISTSSNEILYDGTALNLYTFAMAVPATSLTLTDRLAVKLYSTNSGGKTTTIHTQDGHLCQIITTFSTGITALNGLTAQVQYFQTGTSGTDFNISSTTATHTFNLPTASAANRGALSSADWSVFNAKQNAITLTTTGTSGAATLVGATLNIPQYQAAGTYVNNVSATAPLSSTGGISPDISISQSNASTNGYLSSTDFNTFNNKISGSGTAGYLTKYTGSGNTIGNSGLYDDGTTVSLISRALSGSSATFSSSVNGSLFSVIPAANYNAQFDYTGGTRISQTTPITEGADSMTFVINGASTSTTGNSFIFKTQTGNTTPSAVLTMLKTGAATFASSVTATSFVKTSGTSSQFLKADGSVDSSTYLTTSAAASTYLPLVGGTLTGILNINLSSGDALNVAGNAIFRGDTGVGTPRQLIISSGGSTPVYLEAKGYGANYQTDFGIRTYNSVGTSFEVFYADSSGRVGINQTSPSYQLDVNGTINASKTITSRGQTDPTSGVGMELFYRSADTSSYIQSYDRTNSAWKDVRIYGSTLYFGSQGSNNLTITSTGAATFSSSLTVNGVYNVPSTSYFKGNAAQGYRFNNAADTENLLIIKDGGNVLIGDSTDYSYKLYVNGGTTNGMLFYSTSAANQIKAAGTAPAITFSNTITSPTIGGSLGACTSANQFITGTAAGDMILVNQFTGSLILGTNSAARLTISNSGTASFSGLITSTITSNLFLSNTSSGTNRLYMNLGNSGADLYLSIAGSVANALHTGQLVYASAIGTANNTALQFATSDIVRQTITGGGQVLVGATSQFSSGLFGVSGSSATYNLLAIRDTLSSIGTDNWYAYFVNNSDVRAGGIQHLTSTSVAFITTSDYRLKQNPLPIKNGLNKILSLNPITYNWKEDGAEGEGFYAHELQEQIPYAVFGKKDAMDKNGNINPQGVDYSKIVPTLVKAIQELKQEIDTLKNK